MSAEQSERAAEAKQRNEAWEKLGPKAQLAALDARLGKGVGAKKQRARIQALIDNPPKPTKKVEAEEKGVKPGELTMVGAETGGRLKAKDRRAAEQAKRPGAEARKT